MVNDEDFDALGRVAHACWQTAEDKGWHDETTELTALQDLVTACEEKGVPEAFLKTLKVVVQRKALTNGVNLPEKLMLIVSEASEAMEAYRNKDWHPQETYLLDKTSTSGFRSLTDPLRTEGSKPEGVGSELADVVIRVFDLAFDAGIDIVAEMRRKMEFNESRPFRHGGKRA